MDYNTQRTKLKISDYGRNIYNLIQYTKTVEDRELRTQMASAIVDIMAQNSPDAKGGDDYKRKFWVHLMILAEVEYHQDQLHYRHYGSILEKMVKQVAEYPAGEERDELVRLMAHAMKRDYLLWNSDTVEDDVISQQLETLSDGKLHLPEDFQFKDFREYLKGTEEERRANGTHKKKKKKK